MAQVEIPMTNIDDVIGDIVTPDKIGLGKVDNTADKDKYVKGVLDQGDTTHKIDFYYIGNANVVTTASWFPAFATTDKNDVVAIKPIANTDLLKSINGVNKSGDTMTGDLGVLANKATKESILPVAGGTIPSLNEENTDLIKYKNFIGSFMRESDKKWFSVINIRHRNGYNDGSNYGMYLYSAFGLNNDLHWRSQSSGEWGSDKILLDNENVGNYALTKDTKIGTRNLLLQTNQGDFEWRYSYENGTQKMSFTTALGVNAFKFTVTTASTGYAVLQYRSVLHQALSSGKKYTLEFDVLCNKDTTVGGSIANPNGTALLSTFSIQKVNANTWQHCVLTAVLNNVSIANQVIHLSGFNISGLEVTIANMMLVEGESCGSWQPAPEDKVNIADYIGTNLLVGGNQYTKENPYSRIFTSAASVPIDLYVDLIAGEQYTISVAAVTNSNNLSWNFSLRKDKQNNLESNLDELLLNSINPKTFIPKVSGRYYLILFSQGASTLTFYGVKVEKGSQATDYVPNLTEMQNEISTIKSAIATLSTATVKEEGENL